MTDLTPIFNEVLARHNGRPTTSPSLSLQNIDEFLKEAYRINSHISSLTAYLKSIRQSYLSKSQPLRRITPLRTDSSSNLRSKQYGQPLTDRQRDEIDAEAKALLRQLNSSIRNLADAEQLRQNTSTTLLKKKYGHYGLGSLGSWAAGGLSNAKTIEQEIEEERERGVKMHRESVLWYLREKLREAGQMQAEMMEKRIRREMERNKSVLYKTRGNMPELGGFGAGVSANADVPSTAAAQGTGYRGDDAQKGENGEGEGELTQEQVQMFEKDNQDMLKHYEKTLDQVRTAEKSLVEISELQTQLVNNLDSQSAYIDQLVAESFVITENVGGGNKQLKRAAERPSTAKYVFYASCGLSAFLIVWDLLI